MKKKILLLATSMISCFAVTGALVFVSAKKESRSSMVRGLDDPFVLQLNRSITAGEISAGEASFNTANNNAITFKFASASTDSGLISLASDGYFYNETKLTGITRVEGVVSGGSAKLSYGNDINCLNVGSLALDTSGSPFVIDLAAPSDYIRISDVTGPVSIESLELTYDCSNNYQYAHNREVASDDLFYTATFDPATLTSNFIYNTRSFNTLDETSGYSFDLMVKPNVNAGWPYMLFALKDQITAPQFVLEFYVKGVGQTQLNMNLVDNSNTALLKSGNRLINFTDEWTKISLDIDSTVLTSGKTTADIAKVKFSQSFGTAEAERHVYLDELHALIPETPTRNNIEMCSYVRASVNQTGAASTSFTEVHGSSTSSRKFTFADTTGLTSTASATYRTFLQFDIAADLGNDNGIDVKACTLSFDIKYSSEITSNAEDTREYVTIDFWDAGGTQSTSFFQVNVAARYDDGFVHYSRNLAGISYLSGLSGNVGKIRLGLYRLYNGNKDNATVVVDNLSLTDN